MTNNNSTIQEILTFEKMLVHPRPHYLMTMDLWEVWVDLIKSSSISFLKISEFAEEFELSWPDDENDKLLSEYLFTDLLDLFEIEDINKKRTLFIAFTFAVDCLQQSYYNGTPRIKDISHPSVLAKTKPSDNDAYSSSYIASKPSKRDFLQIKIDKKPILVHQYLHEIDEEELDKLVDELKDLWLEYPDFGMQVNYPSKGKSFTNYPYEELDDDLAKLIILNYSYSSYPDISDLEVFIFDVYNYWIDKSYLVKQSKSFYIYLLSIVNEPSYVETVYPFMVYDILPHYSEEDPDDLIKISDKDFFEKYIDSYAYSEGTIGVDFDSLVNNYKELKNATRDENVLKAEVKSSLDFLLENKASKDQIEMYVSLIDSLANDLI